RLDARDVEIPRGQPRRLVFGSALPDGLDLELRPGRLEDELRALAREGIQALLLEGGPTRGGAFLAAALGDKPRVVGAPTPARSCWQSSQRRRRATAAGSRSRCARRSRRSSTATELRAPDDPPFVENHTLGTKP